jgi:hypothetical protein
VTLRAPLPLSVVSNQPKSLNASADPCGTREPGNLVVPRPRKACLRLGVRLSNFPAICELLPESHTQSRARFTQRASAAGSPKGRHRHPPPGPRRPQFGALPRKRRNPGHGGAARMGRARQSFRLGATPAALGPLAGDCVKDLGPYRGHNPSIVGRGPPRRRVVASARQPPDELREPPRIAKGPSVAEEDESRLQMKELAGGPALHGSVMRNHGGSCRPGIPVRRSCC